VYPFEAATKPDFASTTREMNGSLAIAAVRLFMLLSENLNIPEEERKS